MAGSSSTPPLFFDWHWAGLSEPTQDARLLAAALLVLAGILLATPGIIVGELVLCKPRLRVADGGASPFVPIAPWPRP